jgi:hypothetical protein
MRSRAAALLSLPFLLTACGREGAYAADHVEVTCNRDGTTTLLTSVVFTHPDGVHVHINNETGGYVSALGAEGPGTTDSVVPTPPGISQVACWGAIQDKGHVKDDKPLRIIDIAGYWVDPRVQCTGMMSSGHPDYSVSSGGVLRGNIADPVAYARARARPGDTVESAGYPAGRTPVVRVVRGRRTVKSIEFLPADGGFLEGNTDRCEG